MYQQKHNRLEAATPQVADLIQKRLEYLEQDIQTTDPRPL